MLQQEANAFEETLERQQQEEIRQQQQQEQEYQQVRTHSVPYIGQIALKNCSVARSPQR